MDTCFLCKGNLENKLTTFMVDLGNCIVIIRNVPSKFAPNAVKHPILMKLLSN